MKEILRTLILDSQERNLDLGVPRRLQVEAISGKATICIGVRRSGKSTFMRQMAQRLLDAGVPRQRIVQLDFFDDRLHDLRRDDLALIVEAYDSLYPLRKDREKVYYFFDEIQSIEGWEPFVDRVLRTDGCEVYLTGSSARMLSKEIATQMRGRALSWEIFPFSFREFLDGLGMGKETGISTSSRLKVRNAFDAFWESGGFPEVLALDRNLRVRIHQEYFHAVLYRDLVERHDIPHPKAISDVAHWLVEHCASLYSVNKLTGYLQSLGHKVPKASLSEYLEWFEDAYFFFTVRIFDASLARRNANPKKIYCIDHAMVASISSGILVNSGHLLENLVFLTLRRLHQEIYYYKTKTGKEVDFIVPVRGGNPVLVQVCETLRNPETRKREMTALTEAMAEQGVAEGTIVTRDEEEQMSGEPGTIRVVPAWRFLLEQPDWIDFEEAHR
jgi:predicted AAA+ superfamily ATPase